jgi:hypothetical protein
MKLNHSLATPFITSSHEHTMGPSLMKYLGLKIHSQIKSGRFPMSQICVRGLYDRSEGISADEKPGKLFNFKRPTLHGDGKTIFLNCFPGHDYVIHFGSILASYFRLLGQETSVQVALPSERECQTALDQSLGTDIPQCDVVVMGRVEDLYELSGEGLWSGSGDFQWKKIVGVAKEGMLLGCKHTYWGEIAGRLVGLLAEKGVSTVLYSGKLGSLDESDIPSESVATGNNSIMPDGEVIQWDNLFEDVNDAVVRLGPHVTVPSVLQETKEWFDSVNTALRFVDPEIGHMAKAAEAHGIRFSYLHVVSDNLAERSYRYDLSNERIPDVLSKRRKLYDIIVSQIRNVL